MNTYRIGYTRTEMGFVDIKADTEQDALDKANHAVLVDNEGYKLDTDFECEVV